MNVQELRKKVGAHLRVRPMVRRVDSFGGEQPATDDKFVLDSLHGGFAHLRHVPSDQVVKLGNDNIREYRTPDFLLLRCELIFNPTQGIRIEPFIGNSAPLRPRAKEGRLTGRRFYVVPDVGDSNGDAGKTGEILSVVRQPSAADPRQQRIVVVRLDVSPESTTNFYPYHLRFIDDDSALPERPDPEPDL